MPVSTDQRVDRLWQSAIGQSLIEQDREQQLADRKRAHATIAAAEKNSLAKMPALIKARDAAKAAYEQAKAELEKVKARYNEAVVAVTSLSAQTEQTLSVARRELSDTASPTVDQFYKKLQQELDRLHKLRVHSEPTGKTVPRTGEQLMQSNSRAIRMRIKAVQAAREVAKALKFELLSDSELATRFEEIWGALPDESLLS
jgi:ATP-dependent exoDNAse (exonuclease V) alpha subunit